MSDKITCLFLHGSVPVMAGGLLALADYLHRHGFPSRVVHLGIEKSLDKRFSLEKILLKEGAGLAAISSQWCAQFDEAIKLSRRIKDVNPDMKVVLGGLTASVFYREIMEKAGSVDFLIRGDAEKPLLALAQELQDGRKNFSRIPNLSWRNEGGIVHNEQSFVADAEDMNGLNFTNFSLMDNFPAYAGLSYRFRSLSKIVFNHWRSLHLCVGRGCPVNCSYCGGSSLSQKMVYNRESVVFRSQKKVFADIINAGALGIDCFYICFDPAIDKRYYLELFSLIREKGIKISMIFSCWSLPTIEFIDAFHQTFGEGRYSKLIISPETLSEETRRLNKGFFYSNHDFFEAIEYLKKKKIFCDIFLTQGLPAKEKEHPWSLFFSGLIIKRRIGALGKVYICRFSPDPASPYRVHPERYSFADI